MKKLLYILPLSLLLTACPVGLDFAPGEIDKEKINGDLAGTWNFQALGDEADAEVLSVTLKKVSNTSFEAQVTNRGEMYSLDSDHFLAYETKIDGLNVLYLVPDGEKKYYCYQYKMKDKNTVELADIPLLDGGIDAVKSTADLRNEISASMKKPEFLKEVKTYIKDK